MAPFPLIVTDFFGRYGGYLVYLLIGFAFGYVLEISGFGNSKKLAAQFYFKDMTVLKVMFTAIVVAMVLIFMASAVGLLDYNLLWVNPTYLWPGIVGGLIMGIGFIIGGFCPGTSLVSAATLKIDGFFFVFGVIFGIFLFGETVDFFDIFWNSSYMGRFTIPDWLGLSTGVVVLGVVLMALFMFLGAEQLERIFGKKEPKKAPKVRFVGAGVLLLAGIVLIFIGQPSFVDRWDKIADEKEVLLEERAVYIHPAELLDTMHDHKLNLVMIDVRDEADYNLYHIADSNRSNPDEINDLIPEFHLEPANTVFVLMSNDETAATEAWKVFIAESVPNVYILEGGINNWLAVFGTEEASIVTLQESPNDQLRFDFAAALGGSYQSADPDPHEYELEYIPKIKLELKRAPSSGGCG